MSTAANVVAIVLLITCLYLCPSVQSNPFSHTANDNAATIGSNSSPEFRQFWESINEIISHTNSTRLRPVAHQIASIRAELAKNSTECYRAIESAFLDGLQQEWSDKLIYSNSFFKSDFVSSLISERYSSLGDYEDCLSVGNVHIKDRLGDISFNGKYCLAILETPTLEYYSSQVEAIKVGIAWNNTTGHFIQLARKWLTVRNRFPFLHGICVPSVCSAEELQVLADKYFAKYLHGIKAQFGYCQEANESEHLNFGYIASIIILLLTIFVSIVLTTVYSVLQARNPALHSIFLDMAHCFHVQDNFKSLFSVNSLDKRQLNHNLRFIYGVKAWMIALIVVVHSFCFMSNLLFSKVSLFTKYPSFFLNFKHNSGFIYNIIERGFLLIDLFFVISGFLISHLVIGKFRKIPNFVLYLLNRWLRFVPSVVAILCLTILFQKLGNGPLFHKELTDPYVKPCYDYWWTHVLFINNFWTIDKMCGPNLWFVSADFQLHAILYFVLLVYFRKQLYAYIASIALIFLSFGTLAVVVALGLVGIPRGDYPMRFNFAAPLEAIRLFYTSPMLHIFSYLMGAFVAFRLLKAKRKPSPSPYQDLIFVLLAAVIGFCILCPLPASLLSDHNENINFVHFLAFTVLFVIIVWAAVIAFYLMILVNKSSFFKQFFSARFTLPLGRLSYGIYLLNPLLIWFNVQQYRQTPTLTILFTAQFFSIVYLQSVVLSIFLFVFFESPFHNLSRLMLKSLHNRKHHHNHQNRNRVSSILTDSNEMSDYVNGNASPKFGK